MKFKHFLIMSFVFIVGLSLCAASQSQRKIVRVGFYQFEGYHILNDNGSFSGYGYEFLQRMLPYTDWKYKYIGYDKTWPEMLDMLAAGKIDLLGGAGKEMGRSAEFEYSSQPIGSSYTIMTVNPANKSYAPKDYEHWNGICIGMLADSRRDNFFDEFAKKHGFSYKRFFFESYDDVHRALQEGAIDAAVTEDLYRVKNELVYEKFNQKPFYFIVQKGNDELLNQVNNALTILSVTHPDLSNELQKRYFFHNGDFKTKSIVMSSLEREFIKKSNEEKRFFRVLVNPDRAPFSYFDYIHFKGIMQKVLQLISEKSGLQFRPIITRDYSEYQTKIKTGNYDLILDAPYDFFKAERNGYVLTDPYLIGMISELRSRKTISAPKTIAIQRNSDIMDFIVRMNRQGRERFVKYDTVAEVVNAVESGRQDAGYLFMRTAEYYLRRDLSNMLQVEPMLGCVVDFSVGVNNTAELRLLSIVSKVMRSISHEDIQRILVPERSERDYFFSIQAWIGRHYILSFVVLFVCVLVLGIVLVVLFRCLRNVRKQRYYAEAATFEAQEDAKRLELILRSIEEAVLTTDVKGNIVLMNALAERMLNCKGVDIVGEPHEKYFEIFNPVDFTPILSFLTQCFQNGEMVKSENCMMRTCDGKMCHISSNAAPVFDLTGKITGGVLIFRDITKEYENHAKLHLAQELLEYGGILTSSATFRLNPKTLEISGTKNLKDFLPISEDKILLIKELICKEDWESIKKKMKMLFAGTISDEIFTFRSKWLRNTLRYYRVYLEIERQVQQDDMLVGVVQDVTNVTENIALLKEQQEFQTFVMNFSQAMFFVKDANQDFRYVDCNQAFADCFGKSKETVIGKTDAELFQGWECTGQFLEEDKKIVSEKKPHHFESQILMVAGKQRQFSTLKVPFFGTGTNKLCYVVGMLTDQTDLNMLTMSEKITNKILSVAVTEKDSNLFLEHAVKTLQECVKYDRMFLASCNEKGQLRIYKEWDLKDIAPFNEEDCAILYQYLDKRLHLFDNKMIVNIPNVRQNELTREMMPLFGDKIKSLMIVPIRIKDNFCGIMAVAYAQKEHNFTKVEENILYSCANVFALVKEREQQKQVIDQVRWEEQYFLDNISTPLWHYNAKGEIIQVSRGVYDSFGINKQDGENYSNCKLKEPEQSLIKDVLNSRETHQKLFSVLGKEYLFKAFPVIDLNGELHKVVVSAIDVTEFNSLLKSQKAMTFCLETLLKRTDTYLAIKQVLGILSKHITATSCFVRHIDLAHKKNVTVADFDEKGRGEICNGAACSIYKEKNLSWENRLTESEFCAFPDLPDGLHDLGEDLQHFVRENNVRSLYFNPITLYGKFWGFVCLLYEGKKHELTQNEYNFVVTFTHFVEIILERHETQEKLLEALEKAKNADKAKSYFLANVSHEIRTPLNAVIGLSELLQDPEVPKETRKDYLHSIISSSNALLTLINDILDLSKLEANQMEFKPIATNVEKLIEEIYSVFQQRATEKKIKSVFKIEKLPTIYIDQLRLRQVLFNLIGNAVKFSNEGIVTVKADFAKTDSEVGNLTVHIIDNGNGISEEEQKFLFRPLSQTQMNQTADGVNNSKVGIGLAVSKQMVQRMNGDLTVESSVENGSDFKIVLKKQKYSSK